MPRTVRVTRKYAEWMEDAFTVTVPDDVSDDDLRDNFDTLYEANFDSKESHEPVGTMIDTDTDEVAVTVKYLWVDENRSGIESIDDEITIEAEA